MLNKNAIPFAFQVSGALPFWIRPRSRIRIRSSDSPLGRLPEFLKSFGYVYLMLPLVLSGCAAPLVGGIGAIGLSAVEDRGFSGVASDQALRVKLNYELADFTGIEMTIYKGRVLFTGVVGSERIKAKVVEIARNVVGVKEIIDRMNIKGEDGFSEYARDGWMTTKLKGVLYTDEDVIAPNYLVKTFDKTIYIFGTAQTTEEMNKVMSYAFDITGVKNVVNLMEIRKQ